MNLKKGCQEIVETRQKWLGQALIAQERVSNLVEIAELECGNCSADMRGATLQISIYLPFNLEGNTEKLQWTGQTKLLFEQALGVVWDKQVSCYGYSRALYWKGKADDLEVTILSAPKPLLCKITETREIKEVVTYKAECPEEVLV